MNPDIVFGENMQLMPINRPSTIYINSDEALVNVNVAVMGMLVLNQKLKSKNDYFSFIYTYIYILYLMFK